MANYIVEPKSRFNIRQIARIFRRAFGIENLIYIDVVKFLDVLSKRLEGFSYIVVPNNTLPKKVFATTDVRTGCIKIKEKIFNRACDGDGMARLTIVHEIGHFVLLSICGLELMRAEKDMVVKPFMDPEWQADCFAGEFLMPYHLVKHYSINELIEKCNVSRKAAECQYKAFRK